MYLSFKDSYDLFTIIPFISMNPEWLKFKKYPHIGMPLTEKKDSGWIVKYVMNPQQILTHKFLPLLHRTMSQKKFRPDNSVTLNPSGKRKRKHYPSKKRQIYFPSHLDSIIYSYYSYLLMNAYEDFLADKPYRHVAVAYRKIANEDESQGNKCNIEFAKEAFDFILSQKHRKLSVIVADVTSFFDNLDHRLLHTQWKKVLGVTDLPKDHYVVYKSLVNYRYVNESQLYRCFKDKLIVERCKVNDDKHTVYKRKHVKKAYNLRREKVVAFCTAKDFFKDAVGLIHADKPYNAKMRELEGKSVLKGIPQGTPISATLANLYMLDFDDKLYAKVSEKAGFYQRYSDDLVLICDQNDEKYFYDLVIREIEEKAKLTIQSTKTHIYHYEMNSESVLQGGLRNDVCVNGNKQLEYLGFKFDGKKVYVKTVSFSRFYRKMKRSFGRGVHFAKQSYSPSHALFEWRLYKKYTHLGAHRRLKWEKVGNPPKFVRTTQYDWGNFISYLNKANAVMKPINQDDTIKKQYRKVWNKFDAIKKEAYNQINSSLKNSQA